MSKTLILSASLLLLAGAGLHAQQPVEAVSLTGEPLFRPSVEGEPLQRLEQNLAEARRRYEQHPENAEAIIWLGRRLAYLGRYREAIEVFSRGVRLHPDDPRFLRHRGHRFITTRLLETATADLERAARMIEGKADRIEPDGIPNARNQPTSTTHSNIWYHLGLAQHLRGDFEGSASSYRRCLEAARNDDTRVAASYWVWINLKRLGRDEEATEVLAPIHAEMDIIENGTYRDLLLLFKGERQPDQLLGEDQDSLTSATAGYGVATWHLVNGRGEQAKELFQKVVAGENWAAFGYIAAEAQLSGTGSPAQDSRR